MFSADHPPYPDKRSTVYTYSFPEQEFKLKVGEQGKIAENLAPAGTIIDIDPDKRLVKLKRVDAGKEPLPERFDLIPGSPISTDALREALWHFVQVYINSKSDGTRPFPALRDLLERRAPNISGMDSGSPLYNPESLDPKVSTSLAERMSDTYLFIQGPPGTGKTYTASHMIVDLMKAGKRVGISANSHKAIHNVLFAVEKRAAEQNFTFVGIKKSSGDNDETVFTGANITSAGSTDKVASLLGTAQLFAGTAWLFSHPSFRQSLDYLFIDEAGQLSLAHVISSGLAARNIVLIGDQMQLAQPTQGVHPGESGKSVLDFLLQGRHTIPIEEGILLDTTYRMHPKVCNFISEAIYDGRIKSHPKLEQHRILPGAESTLALPEAGILCDFVLHSGCGQRSEEEATEYPPLYRRLLQLDYRDKRWTDQEIDRTKHPCCITLQYASEFAQTAVGSQCARRHGRQVPGARGRSRLDLNGNIESGRNPTRTRLPLQPKPTQCFAIARQNTGCAGLESRTTKRSLQHYRSDAVGKHTLLGEVV